MAQATGRVTIKLDGDILRSSTGASLQVGGIMRTAKSLDSGQVHYTEEIVPSQISATIVHLPDQDVIGLRALRDFTASFETDTGAGWAIANAFVTDVGEIANGEFSITIQGPPANRVL
jgi:hypothetical protein